MKKSDLNQVIVSLRYLNSKMDDFERRFHGSLWSQLKATLDKDIERQGRRLQFLYRLAVDVTTDINSKIV